MHEIPGSDPAKLIEELFRLSQEAYPIVNDFAAQVIPGFQELPEALVLLANFLAELLQFLQPLADPGQERAGFITGIMRSKFARHGDFGSPAASAADPSFFWICSFGSSLTDFRQASRALSCWCKAK